LVIAFCTSAVPICADPTVTGAIGIAGPAEICAGNIGSGKRQGNQPEKDQRKATPMRDWIRERMNPIIGANR